MLLRIVIIDLLTFLPVLLFASFAEIVQWIAATFVIGLLVTLLTLGQVRSIYRTIQTGGSIRVGAMQNMLAPGLAGVLLLLPGLLTDLVGILVFVLAIFALLTGRKPTSFYQQGQYSRQNRTERSGTESESAGKEKSHRVIEANYETLDEQENKNSSDK